MALKDVSPLGFGIAASRRQFMIGTGSVLAGMALGCRAVAQRKELAIISNIGNAAQRDVLQRLASEFEKASGVKVTINNMDHEAHKTAIRSYLVVSAPDLCFWFSGNRMNAFVKRDLFDDISDLFERENYKSVLGPAAGAVTVDGKQYGLPLGGLLWGTLLSQGRLCREGLDAACVHRRTAGPRREGQGRRAWSRSAWAPRKCGPPPAGSTT